MPSVPLRLLALAGVGAACVGAVLELFPSDVARKSEPGYVDVVFENALVVFAARLVVLGAALVLLVGAVYVAASTLVRLRRGQWLRRVGPFEAEVVDVERSFTDVDSLLDALERAWRANEELERRLRVRTEELHAAFDELGGWSPTSPT